MKHLGRLAQILGLIVLVTGAFPADKIIAADNEEISGYENVTIWVYPEYDDPRLLVMLEGNITGAELPAVVQFLVPSDAQMYSAGSKDIQGRYTGGPPDREASGTPGWDVISYQLTETTFRVEYYTQQIIGYPDKTIDFAYSFLYPVTNLEVIVQEPRESTGFLISPAGNVFPDSEGFKSHLFTYSTLSEKQQIDFSIAYTKSDERPSLAISPSGSSDALTAVIVILVLSLGVGLFLFWMNRSRKKPTGRATRRRTERTGAGTKPKKSSNQGSNSPVSPCFCSYCGKPLKGSGAFCAFCGEALDVEL